MKTKVAEVLRATVIATVCALFAPSQASASVITLTFDQLNGGPPGLGEEPLTYYAGGFGSEGTGPGPNYGITFSSSAIVGCDFTAPCGGAWGVNEAPSGTNFLGFQRSSGPAIIDVAGGFTKSLSFFYTSPIVNSVVDIYSGLNGTGVLLATKTLALTPNDGDAACLAVFCPFVADSVSFSGTANSVYLVAFNELVPGAYDNLTFGAPSATPLPGTWMLMLTGLGALGLAMRGGSKRVSPRAA